MEISSACDARSVAGLQRIGRRSKTKCRGAHDCGGLLRPHVVWFGEPLPRAELEAAVEAARSCELFMSIGTSGIVQPAASLAYAAHNRGAGWWRSIRNRRR